MPSPVRICFIGGSGRSGTSVLTNVFERHPSVAVVPEWRFSIDPDGLVDFYNSLAHGWSPYHFDVKVRRLHALLRTVGVKNPLGLLLRQFAQMCNADQWMPVNVIPRYSPLGVRSMCPGYDEHVRDLINGLVAFTYPGRWVGKPFGEEMQLQHGGPYDPAIIATMLGEFYRNVVESVCRHRSASHYLEKNTWNILWFDKLLDIAPDARLVHIHRDPRDVVASYVKQTWAPNDPVHAAKWYASIMQRWEAVRGTIPAATWCEVSLDDLVNATEATLRAICELWELDWHPGLLHTDLSRSNTGRWLADFSPETQMDVQTILEPQIRSLGYTL